MNWTEQMTPQLALFYMLYGGAVVMSAILCFYLLLRKGNALAEDITPPMRLRRWAAAFFGISALGHLWWFLFDVFSNEPRSWGYVVAAVLDCVTLLITVSGTLLSMLQDRKRPVWPIAAATIPTVILGGLQIAWPDTGFLTTGLIYSLAVYVFFTIYMAVAVGQYRRWLLDNYADLEHKEVWLSHLLPILFLLLIVIYGFTNDDSSHLLLRIADFVLFGLLLWRVETLPQLEVMTKCKEDCLAEPDTDKGVAPVSQPPEPDEADKQPLEPVEAASQPLEPAETVTPPRTAYSPNIGGLLTVHCVNTQLYLQHGLTLVQLSSAVGINRFYLSQYFSSQGTNYNAYINSLRINHFVSLYREAVASQHTFTAQQLAQQSGYRSYSTFSLAFKQRMGQTVTAWMRDMAE